MPTSAMQYSEYELMVSDGYRFMPSAVGFFVGCGRLKNAELSVDTFSRNNELVFDEFVPLVKATPCSGGQGHEVSLSKNELAK